MPRPELSTLRYPNLWQGCVGAWCPSQSGATGYRLFDDSGNNNHGVLSGVDPGTDWMPSQNRLAIDFDGVDDYALATIPTIFLQQGFVTFNFWAVNPSGGSWLCALSNNSNINTWFGLNIGANLVLFNRTDVGGDSTVSSSRIPGNYSTWRMITCISTPTNFAIYQNGILGANTNRTIGTETTLNRIAIGALYRGALGPQGYTQSQFDDIRVYNRALTNSEIQQLYAGGRGAAYERSRGRKKAYVPGYRITAPSRIQTGSARTIDGTDTESLSRGLIGAWCPSLGASGFRLIDRSGNGNHGTLTNMDPDTDWVPSSNKLALDFDGSNDGVRVDSDKYSYSSGAISFWVATTTDSVRSAIAFQETTTFNNLFIVYLGDGATGVLSNELITIGSIKSAVSNIGAYTTTTRSEIFDGKMHHVVVMSNGTTWFLYLDGVQKTVSLGQGTSGSWMNVSNPSALSIGCRLANSNSPNLVLNGQIDDVRIWNRTLTPQEIRLLYTGGRGVGLMPEAKPKRARIVAWDNQDKISVPARVLTNTDSLKRGLVGHWSPSLSGPQGNRLMDLSGQNNHGTLQNMDYQTDYVPSTDKGGRMALDFDGSNDYVDIPDSPSLNPTKQITICCWYYSRGLPSSTTPFTYCLLGKTTSVVAEPYPAFDIRGSSTSTLELAIAIGTPFKTVSLGTITQNTWTFIAATYNGAVLAGYRNGVLVQSSSQSGDIGTTTNPLRLGDNPGFSPRFYNGQLDDVRIYNRALTPQEIRLLAQSRQPERATPQRTRTVFYSSGLVSYLRRRTYNSILGSGVLS